MVTSGMLAMTRWAGPCGEFGDEGLVLAGEVGEGGHAGGRAGYVGDEGIVIADPEEDGGGLGLDGEAGLAVRYSVAEAGEAEDELVELSLVPGAGSTVGTVFMMSLRRAPGTARSVTWVAKLSRPVVGSGDGDDDGRRAEGYELEDVGRSGIGDEGLDDVESGLGGEDGGPAVDLGGVEEGAALEAGGEGVAEEDGVGEVAGVLCLLGLEGLLGLGCGVGAVAVATREEESCG